MAILPVQISQVSNLLSAQVAEQSITSTQSQLLNVQNELSTGKQVNQPSDNPSAAALILTLQNTLEQRQGYSDNINVAQSQLSQAESSLTNVTNLVNQAVGYAQSAVNTGVTPQQMQADAQLVNTVISEVQNQANTQSGNGVYIFGGDKGNQEPYISADGGVQFQGTNNLIQIPVDQNIQLPTQVSGQSVFGGLSSEVVGTANLTPDVTAQTPISTLNGANNTGVGLGTIQLSNGTVTKSVDLSQAQTLGDVVNDINAAGVGTITASLTSTGITLTGGASENISVTDVSGTAASDLGIATAGAGAGNPVTGSALNPQVTALTPLADLNNGNGISNAGIILSNGITSKTIIPTAGGDVQSLLDQINGSGIGVTAEINSTNTGINVFNNTQGTALTIGENGGTTASDLGIRSYSPSSLLSQLNNGQGVQTAGAGTADFSVTASSGSSFSVSLAGATTVQNVITDINNAATSTGVNVTASFATTGNGIILTDNSGGTSSFAVQDQNASTAADELGLTTAATGNTITGSDVNGVQVNGVFTHLQALASALNSGNLSAITAAGAALQTDSSNITTVNGVTGAKIDELQQLTTQFQSQNLATQQLLSGVQDVNETQAITQFTTLQTALQASLEMTAQSQGLSLLNYLA